MGRREGAKLDQSGFPLQNRIMPAVTDFHFVPRKLDRSVARTRAMPPRSAMAMTALLPTGNSTDRPASNACKTAALDSMLKAAPFL